MREIINERLFTFLVSLAADPELSKAFAADPEATMTAENLSKKNKDIIRSQNSAQIDRAIAGTQVALSGQAATRKARGTGTGKGVKRGAAKRSRKTPK
jgi:hypothetical protein